MGPTAAVSIGKRAPRRRISITSQFPNSGSFYSQLPVCCPSSSSWGSARGHVQNVCRTQVGSPNTSHAETLQGSGTPLDGITRLTDNRSVNPLAIPCESIPAYRCATSLRRRGSLGTTTCAYQDPTNSVLDAA